MSSELISDGGVVETWAIFCSVGLIKTWRNPVAGGRGWLGKN
jgi:hypothetical protein